MIDWKKRITSSKIFMTRKLKRICSLKKRSNIPQWAAKNQMVIWRLLDSYPRLTSIAIKRRCLKWLIWVWVRSSWKHEEAMRLRFLLFKLTAIWNSKLKIDGLTPFKALIKDYSLSSLSKVKAVNMMVMIVNLPKYVTQTSSSKITVKKPLWGV